MRKKPSHTAVNSLNQDAIWEMVWDLIRLATQFELDRTKVHPTSIKLLMSLLSANKKFHKKIPTTEFREVQLRDELANIYKMVISQKKPISQKLQQKLLRNLLKKHSNWVEMNDAKLKAAVGKMVVTSLDKSPVVRATEQVAWLTDQRSRTVFRRAKKARQYDSFLAVTVGHASRRGKIIFGNRVLGLDEDKLFKFEQFYNDLVRSN